MIIAVYFFGLILVSVFGPTFIDRSISYHIVFYAVDEGSIDIDEIRDDFSEEIFEKRIHDAQISGFIEYDKSSMEYRPTKKAKMMSALLKPVGWVTNSLETYNDMIEEIHEKR